MTNQRKKDWAFIKAVWASDLNTAEGLLEEGADVHVDDDYPLMLAVHNGDVEMVKLLVRAGADLRARNFLSLAVRSGQPEMAELLLSPDVKSADYFQALKLAQDNGDAQLVELLLAADVAGHRFSDSKPNKHLTMSTFDPMPFRQVLTEWFDDQEESFSELLRRTGSVVAGGTVLRTYAPGDNDWETDGTVDIDIYTPVENYWEFASYLVVLGWQIIKTQSQKPYDRSFFFRNGILRRLAFSHPRRLIFTIDLMAVAPDRSVLQVVNNFDLTICEIWYDGEDVHSYQAKDIMSKDGRLNDEYVSAYLEGNQFIHHRIDKYEQRGFTITMDRTARKEPLDVPGHVWFYTRLAKLFLPNFHSEKMYEFKLLQAKHFLLDYSYDGFMEFFNRLQEDVNYDFSHYSPFEIIVNRAKEVIFDALYWLNYKVENRMSAGRWFFIYRDKILQVIRGTPLEDQLDEVLLPFTQPMNELNEEIEDLRDSLRFYYPDEQIRPEAKLIYPGLTMEEALTQVKSTKRSTRAQEEAPNYKRWRKGDARKRRELEEEEEVVPIEERVIRRPRRRLTQTPAGQLSQMIGDIRF